MQINQQSMQSFIHAIQDEQLKLRYMLEEIIREMGEFMEECMNGFEDEEDGEDERND